MGQDGTGRANETGRGGTNGNGTDWHGTERYGTRRNKQDGWDRMRWRRQDVTGRDGRTGQDVKDEIGRDETGRTDGTGWDETVRPVRPVQDGRDERTD